MMPAIDHRAGRSTLGAAAPSALDALAETLGTGVQRGASLAPYTAIRVGGPADLLLVVDSLEDLADAVGAARWYGVSWRVLGGGCNVLVGEGGVRGLVIINRAASVSFDDSMVYADSGTKLSTVARGAVERSLGGLAWAVGLPGTVGGAVVGNAGAFGGEVADTLRFATVLDPQGQVVERENAWFDFAYRSSRLKEAGGAEHLVLTAVFDLEPGDAMALRTRADEALAWRREHQPWGLTMGSTFKNPAGHYAGQLIEEAGLKGYRIGGARVSEQHANFLVNLGDATADDVMGLIEYVRVEVERQFGVELALEIELLGVGETAV